MYEHINQGIRIEYTKYTQPNDMPSFHSHNTYEIYYLISGTRRYVINNKIYDLKAGDIALIDKYSLHLTKKLHSDAHERYVVYISSDALRALGENADKFLEMMENRLISIPEAKLQKVNQLFTDMHKSRKNESPFSAQLLHNHAYELFSILYNIIFNNEYEEALEFYGKDIDAALGYIYSNFRSRITLEETAKIVNMNSSYFSRYFKKVTGIGFSKYLTALRIKEAEMLLKRTDFTVSEIAEKAGFDTLQHFCNTFKKEKGVSANAYRKQK